MAVVLVCEGDVLRLICIYALQSGRRFEEKQSLIIIIIIIMVIFKCYFSREHIALSLKKKTKKWCEHRIMKTQQIKSTVHDAK